jgi:hypothetical protein
MHFSKIHHRVHKVELHRRDGKIAKARLGLALGEIGRSYLMVEANRHMRPRSRKRMRPTLALAEGHLPACGVLDPLHLMPSVSHRLLHVVRRLAAFPR